MQLYLPIAEVSVNAFLLLGIGGIVGFLSGMFGVGGGFLITPLLFFIGIPPAVAVATGANQVVASSVSGVLAHVSGGGEQAITSAQEFGAFVGARQYSKDFELEADRLGAEIAYAAGFDPRVGAAFFDRIPDPGDQFLGSHPANADRKRVVAETVAQLGG